MVKVLYFDSAQEIRKDYFPGLERAINQHPEITFDEMDIGVKIYWGVGVEELEAKLPNYVFDARRAVQL